MNINELEKLAKDARPSEYFDIDFIDAATPSAILELIAAYREAVAALKYGWTPYYVNGIDAKKLADEVFDTAKRLGVE